MIADLRGLPVDQMRYNLQGTTKIDSLLEVITSRYKLEEPRIEEVIMEHWHDIVGSANAHRCSPLKIDRNVLLVSVSNPITRRELLFQKRSILQRLNQIPGLTGIKDIRFRAA